jgi:hypothetical protein
VKVKYFLSNKKKTKNMEETNKKGRRRMSFYSKMKDKLSEAINIKDVDVEIEDSLIDFKKYSFDYTSIFLVKELEEELKNFLIKENSSEMYDFLKEIECLFDIGDEFELELKINQIITNYIKDDCKRSLNLPGKF